MLSIHFRLQVSSLELPPPIRFSSAVRVGSSIKLICCISTKFGVQATSISYLCLVHQSFINASCPTHLRYQVNLDCQVAVQDGERSWGRLTWFSWEEPAPVDLAFGGFVDAAGSMGAEAAHARMAAHRHSFSFRSRRPLSPFPRSLLFLRACGAAGPVGWPA
jgi:hypothetical protein